MPATQTNLLVVLSLCVTAGVTDVWASQLAPKDAKAFIDRGNEWSHKGEWDEAIRDYDEAIRIDPKNAVAYFHRGTAWHQLEHTDKAIRDYDEAIRLNPKIASAFRNRAMIWSQKRESEKAIDDCTEAIRLSPNYADAFNDRGTVRAVKRDWAKAIADYNEAIRLNPKFAKALNNRAWLQATCPDPNYRAGKKAVEDASLACELTKWNDPIAIGTLAAAYAENQQFDEAVKWQKRVLEFKAFIQLHGEETRLRFSLYQEKKPYRQEVK
jgi:Tfp pilus assembly protein PilF